VVTVNKLYIFPLTGVQKIMILKYGSPMPRQLHKMTVNLETVFLTVKNQTIKCKAHTAEYNGVTFDTSV